MLHKDTDCKRGRQRDVEGGEEGERRGGGRKRGERERGGEGGGLAPKRFNLEIISSSTTGCVVSTKRGKNSELSQLTTVTSNSLNCNRHAPTKRNLTQTSKQPSSRENKQQAQRLSRREDKTRWGDNPPWPRMQPLHEQDG